MTKDGVTKLNQIVSLKERSEKKILDVLDQGSRNTTRFQNLEPNPLKVADF